MNEISGATPDRLLPLSAVVIALVCTAVYIPSLEIPLNVRQDDHAIVLRGYLHSAHNQIDRRVVGLPMLPLRFDLETSGRFRPMFFIASFAEVSMLGADAGRLHAWKLFLTFMIAILLYTVGVALFANRVAGYCLIPLILLAPDPGPAKVWYMLATWCEAYGTIFVLLCLLASSSAARTGSWKWDAVAIVLATLAGASKESFALMIPCLLLVRLWVGQRYARDLSTPWIVRYRSLIVAYLTLFVVYSAVIVSILLFGPDTYGGSSAGARTDVILEMTRDLVRTPYMSVGMVPAILMVCALLHSKCFGAWLRSSWLGLTIVVVWMTGQLLVYGTRGGFWDHYWLPYLLAVAALNAGALGWLWESGSRRLFLTAAVVLLGWSLNGARVNAAAAWNFAQQGKVRMEVVEAVSRAISPAGRVLIVADQRVHPEWSFSVVAFLGFQGKPSSEVWLYDVAAIDRSKFAVGFGFPHRGRLDTVDCAKFDAVVYLDPPESSDSVWNTWFCADDFDRRVVERDLVSLSVRQRRIVRDTFVGEYAINRNL